MIGTVYPSTQKFLHEGNIFALNEAINEFHKSKPNKPVPKMMNKHTHTDNDHDTTLLYKFNNISCNN